MSSDADKATLLNSFFTDQTRLQNIPTTFPDISSYYSDSAVADSIQTTPSEVYDCLRHLKPGKAPGLDDLPPCLLRFCAPLIAASLFDLFNRSSAEASVPREWKVALVVSVK